MRLLQARGPPAAQQLSAALLQDADVHLVAGFLCEQRRRSGFSSALLPGHSDPESPGGVEGPGGWRGLGGCGSGLGDQPPSGSGHSRGAALLPLTWPGGSLFCFFGGAMPLACGSFLARS